MSSYGHTPGGVDGFNGMRNRSPRKEAFLQSVGGLGGLLGDDEDVYKQPKFRRRGGPSPFSIALGSVFVILCLFGLTTLGTHDPRERAQRQLSQHGADSAGAGHSHGHGHEAEHEDVMLGQEALGNLHVGEAGEGHGHGEGHGDLLGDTVSHSVFHSGKTHAERKAHQASSPGDALPEDVKRRRIRAVMQGAHSVSSEVTGKLSALEEDFFMHALVEDIKAQHDGAKADDNEQKRMEKVLEGAEEVVEKIETAHLNGDEEKVFIQQVARDLMWDKDHPGAHHEGHAEEVVDAEHDPRMKSIMSGAHQVAHEVGSKLLDQEKAMFMDAMVAEADAYDDGGEKQEKVEVSRLKEIIQGAHKVAEEVHSHLQDWEEQVFVDAVAGDIKTHEHQRETLKKRLVNQALGGAASGGSATDGAHHGGHHSSTHHTHAGGHHDTHHTSHTHHDTAHTTSHNTHGTGAHRTSHGAHATSHSSDLHATSASSHGGGHHATHHTTHHETTHEAHGGGHHGGAHHGHETHATHHAGGGHDTHGGHHGHTGGGGVEVPSLKRGD